jgi:hypothetical protein
MFKLDNEYSKEAAHLPHMYTLNSDSSLLVHRKLSTGASFIHPISGLRLMDFAVQDVDNKLNSCLAAQIDTNTSLTQQANSLIEYANQNTKI